MASRLREGILTKEPVHGHLFSQARARHFVLTPTALEWYSRADDTAARGELPLLGATCEMNGAGTKLHVRSQARLSGDDLVLVLSGDDLVGWHRAIRNQVSALSTENEALVEERKAKLHLESELSQLREEKRALHEQLSTLVGAEQADINQKLREQVFELESRLSSIKTSAEAAWGPLEKVLRVTSVGAGNAGDQAGAKMVSNVDEMTFGSDKEHKEGLRGLVSELTRSMQDEARQNERGRWLKEFEYVVDRPAREDVDLPTTKKGKVSSSGEVIIRDRGHDGLKLDDFCKMPDAVAAKLTRAEVAALRLYTGPLFRPINYALRHRKIDDWATTISCCYSGILKLALLTPGARVYRGVNEEELKLPGSFLNNEDTSALFAGGIERAFMSTTKSAAVAIDYSGGPDVKGSIFVIDFSIGSRGASVQWLSQYPDEEELLFPPCTALTCVDVLERGSKRCVLLSAQVSTAQPDTTGIAEPWTKPRTRADDEEEMRSVARAAAQQEVDKARAAAQQEEDKEKEKGLKLARRKWEAEHKGRLQIFHDGKALPPAKALQNVVEELGIENIQHRLTRFQFETSPRTLMLGLPTLAVMGLAQKLGLTDEQFHLNMAQGTQAIIEEVERNGTDVDKECLAYVLYEEAGSSERVFHNGLKRDCDMEGNVLPERRGKRLRDFVADPIAQTAGLNEVHVLVLRFYTTEGFRTINDGLRALARDQRGDPHPLPACVGFMIEAIQRLRSVTATSPEAMDTVDVWRGMRNAMLSDDFSVEGGTELAPVSTTADLSTAVQYGASTSSTFMKIVSDSFMNRGAELTFLSTFPGEREHLYPPFTFLKPTGRRETVTLGQLTFNIVEMTPVFGGL